MRVISGKYKSRPLKTVKSNRTRPTTDRNKETMFNLIGPYFDGGIVLDLFAGSGGLGIEALSRGCDYLYSVDHQYDAYRVIKENLASLKIENATVYKMNYKKALEKLHQDNVVFDLVLLDPPYQKNMVDDVFEYMTSHDMLQDQCLLLVEEQKDVVFNSYESLHCIKKQSHGITTLSIFQYERE